MSHMVFYNIKNIISIYKGIVKYDHNKEMKLFMKKSYVTKYIWQ